MKATHPYLEKILIQTMEQLEQIKKKIENSTDPTEIQQLTSRKKELQYLQLGIWISLRCGD